MGVKYSINQALDIPIYQQLVDIIKNAVRTGSLTAGEKLPTVQEMTDMLSIARGTVKRAYDELEQSGFIEKAQGRGTFVSYQPSNSGSRKEQAMAAIDTMFRQLGEMGFSASEINIFLSLKLREWSEQEAHVKVALVECNPENLSFLSEQLRHIGGVDLYSYMLDSIKQYPYKLSEDFDLIVTTSTHSEFLEKCLGGDKKLARIALRPSPRFLSRIIRIPPGKKVGIIGCSRRFGELIHSTCVEYMDGVTICEPTELTAECDVSRLISGLDAVLVPKLYEKQFSPSVLEILRKFDGEIIDCYYELDEGSVLYLEKKVSRLLEDNSI